MFFFFKQKTAYEMRISDWSSDVCSSDLGSNKFDNRLAAFFGRVNYAYAGKYFAQVILRREGSSRFGANHKWGNFPAMSLGWTLSEIGRASCRERVCQYV